MSPAPRLKEPKSHAYHFATCSIELFFDCFECDRKHLCIMHKHEQNRMEIIRMRFMESFDENDSISYNTNGILWGTV